MRAVTMDDLLYNFGRYQRRRNLSPLTIHHRHHQLRSFANFLADHRRRGGLLAATDRDIDAWLDAHDPSPSTRGVYMSYLAAFYRWAVKQGLLAANPVDRMDRPRPRQRLPRPIDDDELTIALSEADARMRAWLLLGRLQGLRVSSMARLRVEGVDRRSMTLRVWAKGNREHAMPLHDDVLRALDAYGMPRDGWVFTKETVGMEDEPLTPATISRYIGRFFRDLGSDATAHMLRHGFVTKVVSDTGDITVAADLAGHRSIETTKGYTKVLAERGRSAIAALTVPD